MLPRITGRGLGLETFLQHTPTQERVVYDLKISSFHIRELLLQPADSSRKCLSFSFPISCFYVPFRSASLPLRLWQIFDFFVRALRFLGFFFFFYRFLFCIGMIYSIRSVILGLYLHRSSLQIVYFFFRSNSMIGHGLY